MSQKHNHGPVDYNRAFALGVALNVAFVAIEAGWGFVAGSLALIADAGHNLSDVLSLLLAWGASILAGRPPTARRTYGFRRATILASLLSGLLLLVALGAIVWEAIGRLNAPVAVNGMTVMIVAGIGVVINTATALMFVSGRKHDLNIKGAYLHMAADASVSLGVVIGGLTMLWTGWTWLDPVLSLLIAAVILLGTWGLVTESLDLAVDAVPRHIDPDRVKDYLAGMPGVAELHDLHIWGMSTTEVALTAHLVMPESPGGDGFLHKVSQELHDRFGIEHATIQIERDMPALCRLGHPESL